MANGGVNIVSWFIIKISFLLLSSFQLITTVHVQVIACSYYYQETTTGRQVVAFLDRSHHKSYRRYHRRHYHSILKATNTDDNDFQQPKISELIDNDNSDDDNGISETKLSLQDKYEIARNIRTLHGHSAAIPYYKEIIQHLNPNDRTAGTRIAASSETPLRHDQACGGKYCYNMNTSWSEQQMKTKRYSWKQQQDILMDKRESIQQLRQQILLKHRYNYKNIANFFGVTKKHYSVDDPDCLNDNDKGVTPSCMGPLFVSPVTPGSVSTSNYPLSSSLEEEEIHSATTGLSCLIALFLLSLTVSRSSLVGIFGEENIHLMQEYGWIYPCSIDPSLMVPYIHVFPLEFQNHDFLEEEEENSCLWIVTDLHPRVLSTTTIASEGNSDDDKEQQQKGNAVMYIGPDSIALAQHFSPYSSLVKKLSKGRSAIHGLDLGCGSGIQALSALMHWKNAVLSNINEKPIKNLATLKMKAVDINLRALRFTQFNAILNDLQDDLSVFQIDLLNLEMLEECLSMDKYHIILGNPPFLPVPSDDSSDSTGSDDKADKNSTLQSISQRYGLFSSGGSSGEAILQKILEIASRYLDEEGGILGVVSEFFIQDHDPQFERFSERWSKAGGDGDRQDETNKLSRASGVLFLNEFPIKAEAYAARRADNLSERDVWSRHLASLNITNVSPGMIYIQKNTKSNSSATNNGLNLTISLVPKTNSGSIWTPSNVYAIQFTKQVSNVLLDVSD